MNPRVDVMRIDAAFQPMIDAAGLDCFDAWMTTPIGQVLSVSERAEVQRFELARGPGEAPWVGYLKLTHSEQARHVLRQLIRLRRPHVEVMREVRLLGQLRAAGFEVMRLVAWGERRRMGWPISGFLLAERVAGVELSALWGDADAKVRERAVRSMGHLIGRLHAAGFFQHVRPRDLICTDQPADFGEDLRMTLIDRGTARPYRQRCTAGRCIRAWQAAMRRYRRSRIWLSPATARRLAEAYLQGLDGAARVPIDRVIGTMASAIKNDAERR